MLAKDSLNPKLLKPKTLETRKRRSKKQKSLETSFLTNAPSPNTAQRAASDFSPVWPQGVGPGGGGGFRVWGLGFRGLGCRDFTILVV